MASGFLEHPVPTDNDLKFGIVKAVRRREPTVDFVSGQEAGLDGIPDQVLLDRAAAEGRVLVSHDRRTIDRPLSGPLGSGQVQPWVAGRLPGLGHR